MPIRRAFLVLWIGLMALASCSSQTSTATFTPVQSSVATASATLKPYHRATGTPMPSPTPPGTATPTPTATFTPVTYTVKEQDDMFGIALRFGVSLEALKTANPTVIPRAMSVGTILIIPITPQPTIGPTPTPVTPTPTILDVQPPVCYAEGGGALWCFILVRNASPRPFENVQGVVSLVSEGIETVSQPAYALLNLLPAGEMVPLVAYFSISPAAPYAARGEITLALPQPDNDTRYLPVIIADQQSLIAPGGLSGQITGTLALPEDNPAANLVWLALTAYTADGQVAGVRKWETLTPLLPGEIRPFSITVFSLGPAIATLSLQSEARP